MAAITIRNLPDEVVEALKARAKRNGRSMEADVREVLSRLATGDDPGISGLEDGLVRHFQPTRRSVPMSEVAARVAANPRTPAQQQRAREWAQEIETDRRKYPPREDEILDPWERAEAQVRRLREEPGT